MFFLRRRVYASVLNTLRHIVVVANHDTPQSSETSISGIMSHIVSMFPTYVLFLQGFLADVLQ